MSVEDFTPTLDAATLAQGFDYRSVSDMAQGDEIPRQARILGIGATIATLGEEIAFYRHDTHWTNVSPSYDNVEDFPSIHTETWDDLSTIGDIYADNSFDRIYAHGNDLETLDTVQLQKFGKAIVRLLDHGGRIKISDVDESFIEHSSYQPNRKELTYSKARVVKPQPYLKKIPEELYRKDLHEQPNHTYAPAGGTHPPLSAREITEAVALTAWEAAKNGASNLLGFGYRLYRYNRQKP